MRVRGMVAYAKEIVDGKVRGWCRQRQARRTGPRLPDNGPCRRRCAKLSHWNAHATLGRIAPCWRTAVCSSTYCTGRGAAGPRPHGSGTRLLMAGERLRLKRGAGLCAPVLVPSRSSMPTGCDLKPTLVGGSGATRNSPYRGEHADGPNSESRPPRPYEPAQGCRTESARAQRSAA